MGASTLLQGKGGESFLQACGQKSLLRVPLAVPHAGVLGDLESGTTCALIGWYPKAAVCPDGKVCLQTNSTNFHHPGLSDQPPVPWAAFRKACGFLLPGLLLLGRAGFFQVWGTAEKGPLLQCSRQGLWRKTGAEFKSKTSIPHAVPSQNLGESFPRA